jgi:serine/threonine protein kinase
MFLKIMCNRRDRTRGKLQAPPGSAKSLYGFISVRTPGTVTKVASRAMMERALRLNPAADDLRREYSVVKELQTGHLCPPSICRVLGFKETVETIELTMERAIGHDLFETYLWYSYRNKRPGRRRTLIGIHCILRALAYMHQRGLAHCDVSPENIVYDRHTGSMVLVDFGMACNVDGLAIWPNEGKAEYRPPEAGGNTLVDLLLADAWCLGASIYAYFHQQQLTDDILDRIHESTPVDPIGAVLKMLLVRDPSKRSTCAATLSMLEKNTFHLETGHQKEKSCQRPKEEKLSTREEKNIILVDE